MPIVYLITNPANGKRYVGKTKSSLRIRWRRHVYEALRGSVYAFHSAIRRYGPESFVLEELGSYESEAAALHAERIWIERLGTVGSAGYNMCAGGRGTVGFRHSAEARARMRQIALSRGQTPSSLAIQRSADVRRGASHSAATILKMRDSQRKRRETPVTDEFREKCRRLNAGKRLGSRASDETRRKMSESQKARWLLVNPTPRTSRGRRLDGPAIARIVELREKGASLGRIAATLTADGVPTYKGGRWARTTVSKLLAHYAPHLK